MISPELLCVCLQGHQLHHVCFILPSHHLHDAGCVYLLLGRYGCVSLLNGAVRENDTNDMNILLVCPLGALCNLNLQWNECEPGISRSLQNGCFCYFKNVTAY